MAIGEAAATVAAKKALERAMPSIDKIGGRLSTSIDRFRVQFTKTFEKHIAKSLQKSRYVKTIVSKDKPI